jgi:hypothetical protein
MKLIHPKLRARRYEQLAAVILTVTLLVVLLASVLRGVHNLS